MKDEQRSSIHCFQISEIFRNPKGPRTLSIRKEHGSEVATRAV